MNHAAEEWYYTSGPDQAGPVTFDELKAKAASGELHPRQDLAWCRSMDQWLPAGDIEGLFERKVVNADHTEADYHSALEHVRQAFTEVDLWSGATRRWFIFLALLFPVLWSALMIALFQFAGGNLSPGFQKLALLIGLIVPAWVIVDVHLSRLTNLGMSKLWFFGFLVPLLNLWLGYRVLACPAGYAKHKKLDSPGWLLAIVYWFVVISSILSLLLVPAMVLSAWNDPKLQEQVAAWREQIEKAQEPPKKESPNKTAEPKPVP